MSNKEIIKKLIGHLEAYKKTILFIISFLIISTGINLCIPILSKDIMDKGFIGGNYKLLIELVLLIFIFRIVDAIINITKEKRRIDIAAKIRYSLTEKSYQHLIKLKINYFNNTNYAEILNNISMDISNMMAIAEENLFFVVTQLFSMTGGIIGLCIIDIRLTLVVLIFTPVKYVVMKYFAKKRKKIMDTYIEKSRKYARWFGDSIGGMREIRLFGIQKQKEEEFADKQEEVIGSLKELNLVGEWNRETDSVLIQLLGMVIYILGADMVFNLQLSVGGIFAFITYSAYVTNPISAILNIGYLISGIIPSAKRYYEFMDLEEEQENKVNQKVNTESMLYNCGMPKLDKLVFRDVSFFYEDGKSVLEHITFTIPKAYKVALIGMNGSGKTTIIDLILRLYEPQEGNIYLGNKNINYFSLSAYREMVSVVSQQIYLFNDTIRNNICLYKKIDENNILEAIRDCGLEEFIIENSLDYVVGENGVMLSGGQKQKIAFARALVHNNPILIFDEATSNTDISSEMQINSILQTKLKQKTVIMITHKSDVLKDVDYIIMLEDGKISGKGSYEQLLNYNMSFRKLIEIHGGNNF